LGGISQKECNLLKFEKPTVLYGRGQRLGIGFELVQFVEAPRQNKMSVPKIDGES
jgi:hypothetical protein